jgi:hypothetical protein
LAAGFQLPNLAAQTARFTRAVLSFQRGLFYLPQPCTTTQLWPDADHIELRSASTMRFMLRAHNAAQARNSLIVTICSDAKQKVLRGTSLAEVANKTSGPSASESVCIDAEMNKEINR